jgi:hypothetical protein
MSATRSTAGRWLPGRRAFLRGAAGAAVALPFLESMPERSPWAANAKPVFAFFICSVGGVSRAQFFPDATGRLTPAGLTAAGKATSHLAAHANNLLLLSGIRWPMSSTVGDAHVNGLCAALSAKAPQPGASAHLAMASGPSADAYIASKVHAGKNPISLYAGNVRNGYAAQRLSFSGPGQLLPVIDNPYNLYLELTGLAMPGGTMTPEAEQAARTLVQSRNSINDLVRDDLRDLMQHPRLSAADRQRLQLHFDSIRNAEVIMTRMCATAGLDVTTLEALKTYRYDAHRTDEIVRLHMSLVATAFACNHRRAASLQWGDPYDRTIYDVPANDERQWPFSFISHGIQSDGSTGNDPVAAQAHAEIDVVRMQTLAAGLDHFKARGLTEQCFVMWTNHYAEGPPHGFTNIPHIIWGSGGGYLKQGEFVDAGDSTNNRLLNTLISAAIQDTHTTEEDFGDGTRGMLDIVRSGT